MAIAERTLQPDPRHVTVADLNLGEGHQPAVDRGQETAEHGYGLDEGEGSGLGHGFLSFKVVTF